jgi:RNA-binding protein
MMKKSGISKSGKPGKPAPRGKTGKPVTRQAKDTPVRREKPAAARPKQSGAPSPARAGRDKPDHDKTSRHPHAQEGRSTFRASSSTGNTRSAAAGTSREKPARLPAKPAPSGTSRPPRSTTTAAPARSAAPGSSRGKPVRGQAKPEAPGSARPATPGTGRDTGRKKPAGPDPNPVARKTNRPPGRLPGRTEPAYQEIDISEFHDRPKPAKRLVSAKAAQPGRKKSPPPEHPRMHKSGEPTKAAARTEKKPASAKPGRRAPILLNEARRRFLRQAARSLSPIVLIGKSGMSDAVIAKVEAELDRHELLKLRFHNIDEIPLPELAGQLAERTHAAVVDTLGKVAVLFRENTALNAPTMHAGGLEIDRGVLRRL